MPRNQTSTNTNATGAATARAAKPRAPRVTASKHSKALAVEATTAMSKETAEEVEIIVASLNENPGETIAKMAYGYWEERGGQGGDALADWVRAEEEYRRAVSAV